MERDRHHGRGSEEESDPHDIARVLERGAVRVGL